MEGPHATASSFMHIGDRITLFHELSNGYLGAEGFSNTQVAIDVDDGVVAGDKTRSESRDAIFVVHGAANYNAAMKIKAYQAKNGMTMDEVQSDPACRTLLLEKAKEDKLNLEEFEQSTGKPVRYGMVVQLQHDTSHKFIVVTRESAELNKDGRRVMLDGNAGEGAWFKIMPRLRVHSEGEKIHVDDPVMLESVDSNLRLSADPNPSPSPNPKRSPSPSPTPDPDPNPNPGPNPNQAERRPARAAGRRAQGVQRRAERLDLQARPLPLLRQAPQGTADPLGRPGGAADTQGGRGLHWL